MGPRKRQNPTLVTVVGGGIYSAESVNIFLSTLQIGEMLQPVGSLGFILNIHTVCHPTLPFIYLFQYIKCWTQDKEFIPMNS